MTTLAYVYGGTITVPLSSGSQGLVDLGSDQKWRRVLIQAYLGTNPTYVVFVQPTKGGTTDVFSTASKTKWASAQAGGNFTTPAGDKLDVVSASALDIYQTLTIYATTATRGTIKAYPIRLNGTTSQGIGSTYPYTGDSGNFQNVHAWELDQATNGNVTVTKHGTGTVFTVTAGVLSVGLLNITGPAQRAYGLPAYCVAGGASTKAAGVWGGRIGATQPEGEEVTLAGTTGYWTAASWSTVEKVFGGDVASASTVSVGQYGIGPCTAAITGAGEAVLPDKGTEELFLSGQRYLAWVCYDTNEAIQTGGAADRLQIALYG